MPIRPKLTEPERIRIIDAYNDNLSYKKISSNNYLIFAYSYYFFSLIDKFGVSKPSITKIIFKHKETEDHKSKKSAAPMLKFTQNDKRALKIICIKSIIK